MLRGGLVQSPHFVDEAEAPRGSAAASTGVWEKLQYPESHRLVCMEGGQPLKLNLDWAELAPFSLAFSSA